MTFADRIKAYVAARTRASNAHNQRPNPQKETTMSPEPRQISTDSDAGRENGHGDTGDAQRVSAAISDTCTCGSPDAYSLNPAEVVTHRTDGPCTIDAATTNHPENPKAETGAHTTSTGTTITVEDRHGDRVVICDNPRAPEDMRNCEVGRIIEAPGGLGFQSAPLAVWGLTPDALRIIADLVEAEAQR